MKNMRGGDLIDFLNFSSVHDKNSEPYPVCLRLFI
jgi:hypothetical protein